MNKDKARKIDAEKIDLQRMAEQTSDQPGLIAFPHTVGGAVIRPEDQGKIKGRALSAMREQTSRQMKQLYEQAQLLAEQAREIQQRATLSERIYESEISFEPLIGHVYHLYERQDGSSLLSMVGPDEWGRSRPFKCWLATVKLLADHTWDILEQNPDELSNL
jgi:hypothetical protein